MTDLTDLTDSELLAHVNTLIDTAAERGTWEARTDGGLLDQLAACAEDFQRRSVIWADSPDPRRDRQVIGHSDEYDRHIADIRSIVNRHRQLNTQ